MRELSEVLKLVENIVDQRMIPSNEQLLDLLSEVAEYLWQYEDLRS